ncbi:ROK family transcriptional regulator [Paramicrobacterium chengjingii]|uniref:ROK family transcriptional regulator n=1 Tax=Paramicrobacterium chengjingii TaxID=2769067 RepID=A0ABX6YG93_9MICO|nr:ROK family transcriptional regulator [Microbacterium chengjingii]QPZ37809.1 ROK family transcriptional regulator [Microbacterium chengjingii]
MATKSLPGTPSWLGATNDQKALALLLEYGVLTRNRLGELSGLSKPTASQMVSRLEAAGLIEPVGEIAGSRGPTAMSYGVRRKLAIGVAIDVQPEVTRSVVIDAAGGDYPVVEDFHARSRGDKDAATELTGAVHRACAQAGVDPARVRGAVVGVQAAVNASTGELSFTDEMPGWPRENINTRLSADLGFDVVVWNDVKVAAVAEREIGVGKDLGSFALFWVGNGLGVAFDIRGEVLAGASGGAGEIGYLSAPLRAADLDPRARDLQDLISGDAIASIAQAYGVSAERFEDLLAAIDASNERDGMLTQIAERVALGIAPVLAVLDPEAVILSGPVGVMGGDVLAREVAAAIENHTRWHPLIQSTGVTQPPVLAGAACVLKERLTEGLIAAITRP